jgi:hypothetical protein
MAKKAIVVIPKEMSMGSRIMDALKILAGPTLKLIKVVIIPKMQMLIKAKPM